MMFSKVVDEEVDLLLIHPSMSSRLACLARENCTYLSKWLAWTSLCKTEDDFDQFIKKSLIDYAAGKSLTCAIYFKGEIVGVCAFNEINHSLSSAIIGYWLAEKMQGKGIVTRACQFLIEYAHDDLGIDKVEISAAKDNISSRAVCERLGMTLEGIITNRERVGDRIVHHAIYGVHKNPEK